MPVCPRPETHWRARRLVGASWCSVLPQKEDPRVMAWTPHPPHTAPGPSQLTVNCKGRWSSGHEDCGTPAGAREHLPPGGSACVHVHE